MRFLFIFFVSVFAYSENIETGKTYQIKKLKYFAPKGEDKNSVAHFILYKDSKRKHVVEIFCLIPFGENPAKTKKVHVGERSVGPNPTLEYFCDLEK